MRTYQLPGLQSMSEFVQTGDCGPDVYLMALHAMAPGKFPLTWGGLAAVDHDEETRGYAAANGAQTIYQMSAYLTAIGVPHSVYGWDPTQNTGGAAFSLDALHTQLKTFAAPLDDPHAPTPPPVIVETSMAGAGFVQDEAGVKFHFAGFGGISVPETTAETGGYWRVDGDAVMTNAVSGAPSPALLTQWAQIVAAGIIAYITIDGLPPATVPGETTGGPQMIVIDKDAGGNTTGAHDASDTGKTVGIGLALDLEASQAAGSNILAADILVGETYAGDFSGAVYGNPSEPQAPRYVAAYSKLSNVHRIVDFAEAGAFIVALVAEVAAAQAQAPAPSDNEAGELSPANVAAFRSTLTAQANTAKQLADQLAAAASSLPTGV